MRGAITALAAAFLVAGAALGLTACGGGDRSSAQASKPAHPIEAGDPGPASESVWSYPLDRGADVVSSPQEPDLIYSPDAPSGLGEPKRIVATPRTSQALDREIAWVFDDPSAGPFLVLERVADESQEELEEPATLEPGCQPGPPGANYDLVCTEGGASVHTLGNGTRAVLIDDDDLKTISWLEPVDEDVQRAAGGYDHPALLVTIAAPPGRGITSEKLLDLANRF